LSNDDTKTCEYINGAYRCDDPPSFQLVVREHADRSGPEVKTRTWNVCIDHLPDMTSPLKSPVYLVDFVASLLPGVDPRRDL
jgi:hypothetical protein